MTIEKRTTMLEEIAKCKRATKALNDLWECYRTHCELFAKEISEDIINLAIELVYNRYIAE